MHEQVGKFKTPSPTGQSIWKMAKAAFPRRRICFTLHQQRHSRWSSELYRTRAVAVNCVCAERSQRRSCRILPYSKKRSKHSFLQIAPPASRSPSTVTQANATHLNGSQDSVTGAGNKICEDYSGQNDDLIGRQIMGGYCFSPAFLSPRETDSHRVLCRVETRSFAVWQA